MVVKRKAMKKKGVVRRRTARTGRKLQQKGVGPVVRAAAYGATAVAAYRGSTRTQTESKRNRVEDTGSYQQWRTSAFSRTFGRLTQKKLGKLRMDGTTLFWRSINNPDIGTGQQYFSNFYTAGSAAGLPCWVWELNSCYNIVNETAAYAAPCYEMSRAETPGIIWSAKSGQTAANTLSTDWQVERASVGPSIITGTPLGAGILQWVDVRLNLFGCKAQPTKVYIELCQFDEEVIPSVGTFTDQNYVKFWDQQIRPFIYNDVFNQNSFGATPRMKRVMDRKIIEFQPTSTTESDADPHLRTVKLFWRLNRYSNFMWKDSLTSGDNVTNTQLTTPYMHVSQGDNQNRVHPKARLYLMMRAVKFVRDATYVAQTNTSTPSFNIQLRTRWLQDS